MWSGLWVLQLFSLAFSFTCTASSYFVDTCSGNQDDPVATINVRTADECCTLCAEHNDCFTWTFNYGESKTPLNCYLKGNWTWPFESGNCTTGIRDFAPTPSPFPTPQDAKNVLFIAVDDMRPSIGAYNFSLAHTPFMDQLAKEGLLFTHAYTNYAYCSPTRNSFLSGRLPDTTRVWNFRNHFRERFGSNWTTLPGYFKQHGYLVIGGGKIFHPTVDHTNVGLPCDDYPASWSDEYPYYTNEPPSDQFECANSPEDGNGTWCAAKVKKEARTLTDQKIRDNCLARLQFLYHQRQVDPIRPFFLACGFHKPHVPFIAPQEFFDLLPDWQDIPLPDNTWAPQGMPDMAWHYPADVSGMREAPSFNGTCNETRARLYRRAYYAAISYTDYNIGQVLESLDKFGLSNDTLVVVFGDHGFHLQEQNTWAKMANFEMSTHIPLIMRAPWKTNSTGKQTQVLAELIDVYPTVSALAGLPSPYTRGQDINGTSLEAIFNDPSNLSLKYAAFSQFGKNGTFSVATQFLRNQTYTMGYTIRVRDWRYTAWFAFDDVAIVPQKDQVLGRELYSHSGDTGLWLDFPGENINLVDDPKYESVVDALHQNVLDYIQLWPGPS